VAAEKSAPAKAVKKRGFECPTPTWMSFSITVPAVVPSVVHSSMPFTPSLAPK
jgi:hypothetical protein